METIQFYSKGNMRYVLFQVDEQHYLLDRRPRHLLVYFFIPSSWFFYQNVFPITDEEYSKMNFKHSKASKFTIPTSLIVGLVVFFNSWSRLKNYNPFEHPNTNISMQNKWILLVIGLILAFLILQSVYLVSKKSIENLLGRKIQSPIYYKIRPEKSIRFNLFMIFNQIFAAMLVSGSSLAFMYLGNLPSWFGTTLIIFIFLLIATGAVQPQVKWQYYIVDKLAKYESEI
ncbi:DUF443 family protein [Streptococcus pluranimalium]|uniref:DUF443 domain-containing protein n=1 Tax=Streptococcus pluranimalium TaxID=82348 RepID=A0A2L0D3E6_9STRE|nr:DUF443 family protein [Streptococcus pluranimalium]AUW96347.1 hypothetical protein C0J00_04060 [Streptococcus pluranimalium]